MMENAVEDIGTLLKNRREKLGYSLEDAAQHTRIRINQLESIENNRFSDLPGPVYVTGFIKAYASYLGLDSNSVQAMLEDLPLEVSRPVVRTPVVTRHQPGRKRTSAANSGGRYFILGLLVVLLLGGAAAYYLPGLLQDRDSSAPAGGQEPPTKELLLPQVAPALNSATTEPVENAARLESPPDSGSAEPAIQDPDALPVVPSGGGSLRMLAVAESALVIYLDEREPHEYKLYDGLDLSWKIRQKVRIELAGPHVARFWLDGQEIDLGDLESFELNQGAGE